MNEIYLALADGLLEVWNVMMSILIRVADSLDINSPKWGLSCAV